MGPDIKVSDNRGRVSTTVSDGAASASTGVSLRRGGGHVRPYVRGLIGGGIVTTVPNTCRRNDLTLEGPLSLTEMDSDLWREGR